MLLSAALWPAAVTAVPGRGADFLQPRAAGQSGGGVLH